MKTNITDVLTIENMTTERQIHPELHEFRSKLGSFPLTGIAPFTLRFENRENKRLHILAETDVTAAVPCDRCLEDVPVLIHLAIERIIPIGETDGEDEAEDIGFLAGTWLDVDRLIHDQILENWPMKVLCSEDCKGICKKCGTNLNHGSCLCDRTEPDPRMAAIQDIFNQFKEV